MAHIENFIPAEERFQEDKLFVVFTEDEQGNNKNSDYVCGELVMLRPPKAIKPRQDVIDYVMEHTPWLMEEDKECIDTECMYDMSYDTVNGRMTAFAFGWTDL